MALIRWQPFHEMEALQRDMNHMFEALASSDRASMRQSFMPLAEMEETEDAIHLKIEVPGMNTDDLDVQVTKEAVMITGERKSQSKSEKNGMKRTSVVLGVSPMNNSFKTLSEFRYGSFQRTIPLPMPIDNNQVKGDYQDGILTLELPKMRKEENKVTKVNIGSNNSQQISSSSQAEFNSQDTNKLPENASSQSENSGYGNQDAWDDSQQTTEQTAAN